MSRTRGPTVNTRRAMRAKPSRFRTNPVFAMVGMSRQPLSNMIALGGVATGSMKAQEALNVAGIISRKG